MVVTENRCVGCPPGVLCLGSTCSNRNMRVVYCDECHDEIGDNRYMVDCKDLCDDCYSEMMQEKKKNKEEHKSA